MLDENRPWCERCGQALGVYEPLIWLSPDGPVETGLLGLRDESMCDPDSARLLHRGCWRPE